MFIEVLFITKKWKQPECPSIINGYITCHAPVQWNIIQQ